MTRTMKILVLLVMLLIGCVALIFALTLKLPEYLRGSLFIVAVICNAASAGGLISIAKSDGTQ